MMHRSILASLVVLSHFSLSLPVRAQQVGDKVVVISDSVEIKVRQDVIDTTNAGAIFVVREVQGNRVGVNSVHGTGFIEKQHLIPLSKAVSHWSEVIRSDSKDSAAYIGRGLAYRELRDYDDAIADYNEAIRIDPKYSRAYNARAWIWATCPDVRFRDGQRAVASATRACELDPAKASINIGTLAAAYAEAGDFENAVKWQLRAIQVAPTSDQANFQTRLDLFRSGKPYREEAKK